ncbi:MAG: hypothetical protein CSA11_06860 [Chloroflexi bacterium]|nr:MAG: hypothetical protein CSA11_06860 [Chloroflexota bacterium]
MRIVRLSCGILLFCLVMGGLWGNTVPLQAQIPLPTATPDEDGIIYAEVQVDDSLWAIANRSRIRLDELLRLNNMTEESIIRVGDLLIIGYLTPPATETPMPTVTPTLSPPTPTFTPHPLPETAVCLRAYVDVNQNGIHDLEEKLRPSVAFTIFTENAVVANYVTTGVSEPHCIHLEPGTYQITRSLTQDEHLTTEGNMAIVLHQGDMLDLAFGGYIGPTATPSNTPEPMSLTAAPESTPRLIGGKAITATAVPAPEHEGDSEANGRASPILSTALSVLVVLMVAGVIFFVVRMRHG